MAASLAQIRFFRRRIVAVAFLSIVGNSNFVAVWGGIMSRQKAAKVKLQSVILSDSQDSDLKTFDAETTLVHKMKRNWRKMMERISLSTPEDAQKSNRALSVFVKPKKTNMMRRSQMQQTKRQTKAKKSHKVEHEPLKQADLDMAALVNDLPAKYQPNLWFDSDSYVTNYCDIVEKDILPLLAKDGKSKAVTQMRMNEKAENEATERPKKTSVFLTGGSGFLGAFIVRDLLTDESVDKIYCHVRCQSQDHGATRLMDNLQKYDIAVDPRLFSSKIVPVPGDVEANRYSRLASSSASSSGREVSSSSSAGKAEDLLASSSTTKADSSSSANKAEDLLASSSTTNANKAEDLLASSSTTNANKAEDLLASSSTTNANKAEDLLASSSGMIRDEDLILGIRDESMLQTILAECSCVIHNGAGVNFAKPLDALIAPNVLGTLSAMELAARGTRRRGGMRFIYISSVSVFSMHTLYGGADELCPDPTILISGYSRSKWLAEQCVFCAGREGRWKKDSEDSCGLEIMVIRPGRITGDSVFGASNCGDWFSRYLKTCSQLKRYINADLYTDMTQVDDVSRLIVDQVIKFSWTPSNGGKSQCCLHAVSTESLTIASVAQILQEELGIKLKPISWDTSFRIVEAFMRAGGKAALRPLLKAFRQIPISERAGHKVHFTSDMHHSGGDAESSLRQMIRWLVGKGYLKGKTALSSANVSQTEPARKQSAGVLSHKCPSQEISPAARKSENAMVSTETKTGSSELSAEFDRAQ